MSLPPLAPDTLEILKEVSPATVTTQLIKKAGMRSRSVAGCSPINPARSRFVGIAYTIRFVPLREDLEGRNNLADPASAMHKMVEQIPAGSVVMADVQGIVSAGVIGDIIAARLLARGVVAFVCDGGMRDIGPLRKMDLPVFARTNSAPPTHSGMISAGIQEVIGIGGVLVEPGDVVTGDEDGAVVIPRHLADAVAKGGLEQERMEAWVKSKVEEGRAIPGLYPPNEATAAEYAAFKAANNR